MKMKLKLLEWFGVITAIAYSLFCGLQRGTRVPRFCFAIDVRHLDRCLGLSRRTSGYLASAVFLPDPGIHRHDALVLSGLMRRAL